MFKVILQNVNQYYFSLQTHKGSRISLSLRETVVFRFLSNNEAQYYVKYIPLGLSVIIQPDNQNIIEVDVVENVVEISDNSVSEVIDNSNTIKYTLEDLQALKKAQLKEIATDEGINTDYLTKQEILDLLVSHYGM